MRGYVNELVTPACRIADEEELVYCGHGTSRSRLLDHFSAGLQVTHYDWELGGG